ncbi:MAG TPA: isoaspartyl peptidase/L-asparaginase [Pyrinomonadaceae bacterium]|jgi:beta-aspartyl-peptidase (threonine type)|nr:isoaspartyl peptidase/L-asparaginase [Pyrinomonadaceae bacterium]
MRAIWKGVSLGLLITALLVITSILRVQETGAKESVEKRSMSNQSPRTNPSAAQPFGFAIHGGAGTILKSEMSPEMEAAYRAKLQEAVLAGYNILKDGGSSLDAVETAIRLLEDSPLFNAGKGSVLNSAGTVEMDASIMDGKTLKAGAVTDTKRIKNPISLARLVMEQTTHVLLASDGAEAFAREKGLEFMPPEYFITDRRIKELEREKEKERKKQQQQNTSPKPTSRLTELAAPSEGKYGTVGAVALDKQGNLAAGTSTGGKTNKRVGRVGDSPIIGAGNYANNRTCAVSGTGDGEYFMRLLVAYDVSALMEYKGMSLEDAARTVVMEKLKGLGGDGGLIAIDRQGRITMPFNTPGMYRAYVAADGTPVVRIYQD